MKDINSVPHYKVTRVKKNRFNINISFSDILLWLLKLLKFIILTPFFIFSFLKNWIISGLGLVIFTVIGGLTYLSFTNHPIGTSTIDELLLTDTSIPIIIVVAGLLSLITTIGQYRGDID